MSVVLPRPGDPAITLELVAEHGLTSDEFDRVCRMLGANADVHRARHRQRAVERALLVQAFAHRCSGRCRPKAPYVLQGPGENAGVIAIGDGLAVAFKIESHNHPSAVEPYQGAATGVGGILRDVFTMGARPIAMLNSLRFGSLDSRARALSVRRRREGHRRLRQLRRHSDRRAARSCSIQRTRAIRSSTRCASDCCARTS